MQDQPDYILPFARRVERWFEWMFWCGFTLVAIGAFLPDHNSVQQTIIIAISVLGVGLVFVSLGASVFCRRVVKKRRAIDQCANCGYPLRIPADQQSNLLPICPECGWDQKGLMPDSTGVHKE